MVLHNRFIARYATSKLVFLTLVENNIVCACILNYEVRNYQDAAGLNRAVTLQRNTL